MLIIYNCSYIAFKCRVHRIWKEILMDDFKPFVTMCCHYSISSKTIIQLFLYTDWLLLLIKQTYCICLTYLLRSLKHTIDTKKPPHPFNCFYMYNEMKSQIIIGYLYISKKLVYMICGSYSLLCLCGCCTCSPQLKPLLLWIQWPVIYYQEYYKNDSSVVIVEEMFVGPVSLFLIEHSIFLSGTWGKLFCLSYLQV